MSDQTTCHCGKSVSYGFDGDMTHHRGMCEYCDLVRCDAYPGACDKRRLADDAIKVWPLPHYIVTELNALTNNPDADWVRIVVSKHPEFGWAVAAVRDE